MNPVRPFAKFVLLASLSLMGLNYAWTDRWSGVAGSIHGPKEPLFLVLLAVAALVTLGWNGTRRDSRALPIAFLVTGLSLLLASLFIWFPPHTWNQLPFLDNWPARFQSSIDALQLYKRGVAAGWEWHFLGGYHLASDVTVTLSALGALPIAVFGPAIGFHVLHFVLLLALPALVYLDLGTTGTRAGTRRLATGLVAFFVTGWFGYYQIRSGDTNSLGGVVCVMAALAGSQGAAAGRRWGTPLLVLGLVLANYTHGGFFWYGAVLLAAEMLFYRDWRRGARALLALATGLAAAAPLMWELWRYPAYFTFNNVVLNLPPFSWESIARRLYYNVEILFLPGRWFNDFAGLTNVLLPVVVYVAWTRRRGRAEFYAWAVLAMLAVMRLNLVEFGYAFARPVHLLPVLVPVVLAVFLAERIGHRVVVAAVSVLAVVYLQYLWMPLPHIATTRDLDPALVDWIRSFDGALVLFEDTFHRDMDLDPVRESEPSPLGAHIEGYLVPATGKRFYSGVWDGWQWSPSRVRLLDGGAFQGHAIGEVPREVFQAELRRWGVRHLVVWSRATNAYLRDDAAFAARWHDGLWTEYEFLTADPRDVAVDPGRGALRDLDPLGADVVLDGVSAGTTVVVRTSYFPAWTAEYRGADVPVFNADGQLAFRAPADGSYTVSLVYPRRYGLTMGALVAVCLGLWACARVGRRLDPAA